MGSSKSLILSRKNHSLEQVKDQHILEPQAGWIFSRASWSRGCVRTRGQRLPHGRHPLSAKKG